MTYSLAGGGCTLTCLLCAGSELPMVDSISVYPGFEILRRTGAVSCMPLVTTHCMVSANGRISTSQAGRDGRMARWEWMTGGGVIARV